MSSGFDVVCGGPESVVPMGLQGGPLYSIWAPDDDFQALLRLAERIASCSVSWSDSLAEVDRSTAAGCA
ncbi:MAG: hypothetical protein ACLP50_17325 [Solirubrobacteraceae bacterium]